MLINKEGMMPKLTDVIQLTALVAMIIVYVVITAAVVGGLLHVVSSMF